MHELSIAIGIVDIAEKEARKAGVDKVVGIELEIGSLSGIEIDALEFVWHMAIKDSVLENAWKKINVIEAKAKCMECEHEFDIKNFFDSCPKCGSHFKDIYKGKELRVKSIEI